MTRRAWFATAFCVAATAKAVTAAGVHITGTLSATFQEAQEGYFSIGKDIAIVVKPESVPHQQMQAMVDKQVQLSVFDLT